ncbi:MAG TPA: glycogen synthase GlgA, partial [Candidatus Binatia bacterium]|nr:glycogen synthase GlgA [Candidatus Binatia bacterium]
ETAVALPAYRSVLDKFPVEATGLEVAVALDRRRVAGTVLKANVDGAAPVYLIRNDDYFSRPGLYGTPQGDYPDNAERFAFFGKAALELAAATGPWDVLHCHDWQSSLVPVLSRLGAARPAAKTILTIHNLAHQGLFPYSEWPLLGLDPSYFTPKYLEFYGKINFLKGGILFADALATVSRKYAEEILTPEYGCGLEGVLRERQRDLHGVLNGVDYGEWSPESDEFVKKNYGPGNMAGKAECKQDLQQFYNLPQRRSTPLLGIVSRLADQKGIDLLLEIVVQLLGMDLQMVVLGAGDQKYQELISALPSAHPRKIGVTIGFDNALAHKIEAGADIFLMPSRYEPCGLNQIYSLKYGTVPVVRATGGLDDTIEDFDPLSGKGNGFKFADYSGEAFLSAIKRALAVYINKKAWSQVVANGMAANFSWERAATDYLQLYRQMTGGRSSTSPPRPIP